MFRRFRSARPFAALLVAFAVSSSHAEIDEATRLKIEALRRLKDSDPGSRPTLRQAVDATLEKVRGEPEFVELVRDYRLTNRQPELLGLVASNASAPVAVLALRTLLAQDAAGSVRPLLDGSSARGVAEALGHTGDNRAAALLHPLVRDPGRDLTLRRAALRGLAKSRDGADAVLAMAREGTLPEDLRTVAAGELAAARWPAIKEAAARLLPPPAAKGDAALPPVSDLVRRTGDIARGAAIFRREDVNCISCHQVGTEGIDFGPKLTEIGDKLGKDALYDSILDPNAGIAFGYEAWSLRLKNGDEAFGLIASETETEVSVKAQGGLVTRLAKPDIESREKQPRSAMPDGLQAGLTAEEFVDLVEYLASLRKAR